jgi:hypothetical protein
MHDQILPHAECLAAHLANVRLLARVYTHVNLQVSLAADGLAAQLARDLILAGVYLQVYLQRGFPIALEVADIALVLLPVAMRLHVHIQIGRTRVRCVTHLADERLLAGVSEQMSFQCLIRVKAFAANLAMRHVFLIMLFLVETQIISGDLRDAAYVAGESFVVLLQMDLQELLGLEALAAQNALERLFLLVRFYHVLSQLLLVGEELVAFPTAIFSLRVPLVILPVLQELQFLQHTLPANVALVNRCAFTIGTMKTFCNTYLIHF